MNESLNYRDILAWRDREDEWMTYERRHKTVINATLEIKTSLVEKLEIPVEASLRKPKISTEASLDFGALQVGSRATKDVVLTNPTSETVQVQLFVSYDLDKSFISKQTDKQAWLDKGAFRDRMLRQIDLHMRGVDLEYVAQIEHIFEELRNLRAAEDYVITELDVNEKPRKNIVDILLTYYRMSEDDRQYEID